MNLLTSGSGYDPGRSPDHELDHEPRADAGVALSIGYWIALVFVLLQSGGLTGLLACVHALPVLSRLRKRRQEDVAGFEIDSNNSAASTQGEQRLL